MRFYNLRYRREPTKAWDVTSGDLAATVTPIPLKRNLNGARWRLVVDVRGPSDDFRILSVTSPTTGVTVTRSPEGAAGAQGSRRIEAEMIAPPICPGMPRREDVTLVVRYQVGEQVKVQQLHVDHRCLIGDVAKVQDAESYARLARQYLYDPLIERLIRGASAVPVGTPEEEVRRLKEAVGFGEESLRIDPALLEMGGEGNPYVLSPTETARLGSDCKGWSVLASTYMARRGFQAAIAYRPGHVWVQVQHKGKIHNIDFLGDPPEDPPLSVAWVSEEPLGSETFLKYNFGRLYEKLQLSRGRSRNERQISRRKR